MRKEKLNMENNPTKKRGIVTDRSKEESAMSILDSYYPIDSSHVHESRLAFLEAVRTSSIVPTNGTPPTKKMVEAVFGMLREAQSLELVLASYELLCELEKRFPRVYLLDEVDGMSSPGKFTELVVLEEAWSPLSFESELSSRHKHAADKRSKECIDPAGFLLLLEGLVGHAAGSESSNTRLELLAILLTFQYLITVIEGDFLPHKHAFSQSSDWIALRESLLNRLLSSRRINYKGFVKDCIFVVSNQLSGDTSAALNSGNVESSSPTLCADNNAALVLCLPEIEKGTRKSMQRLLRMMTELDMSRKEAGSQGFITRADGVRSPVVELILDELSYDKDMISPFLKGFEEPELKLEIVSEFFQRYTAKPSTRTRKSNGLQDAAAITGFFKCFSNNTTTKAIVNKISVEAVQELLAHALQACMSLPQEKLLERISELNEAVDVDPIENICRKTVAAFAKLREIDKHLELLPIGEEALFIAATVLVTKA